MTKSDIEAYAKFVENWPRQYGALCKKGRKRFTIDDINRFVRGACDLIAEDIRAGKVAQQEARETVG